MSGRDVVADRLKPHVMGQLWRVLLTFIFEACLAPRSGASRQSSQ